MPDAPTDLVLALDEGTTSARTIVFDHAGAASPSPSASSSSAIPRRATSATTPRRSGTPSSPPPARSIAAIGGADRIAAIGITNQRETAVVWDRASGGAVADAIVWQSRVTAPFCEGLRAAGHEELVRARTGLPIDAYFTGPKIRQILVEDPSLRSRAERGELAAGTVESFLIWRLTGGRAHVTDVSNASRTLLLDIQRGAWDDELLPADGGAARAAARGPELRPRSTARPTRTIFGRPIPIAAAAGDQQAATFGQACFAPGEAKVTLGTGAFLLANTGDAGRRRRTAC